MDCVFYDGNCSILLECNCSNCKFYKTTHQLDESRKATDKLLFERGLKCVRRKRADGTPIMTLVIDERRTPDEY